MGDAFWLFRFRLVALRRFARADRGPSFCRHRARQPAYRWRRTQSGPEFAPPPDIPAGVFFVIVAAELVLGLSLLLNIAPRISTFGALVLFAAFAAYSLHAVLEDRSSCGCFGAMSFDPALTFTIDSAAVALLMCMTRRWTARTFAAVAFFAAFVVVSSHGNSSVNPRDKDGVGFEIVAGRALPVSALTGAPREITHGDWKLVFHRDGCKDCEKLLEGMRTEAAAAQLDNGRVLLVRVVNHDMPPAFHFSGAQNSNHWMSCTTRLFVPTPTVVCIHDGIVASVDQPSLSQPSGDGV